MLRFTAPPPRPIPDPPPQRPSASYGASQPAVVQIQTSPAATAGATAGATDGPGDESAPDVREPLRLLLRDLRTSPRGLTSREAARRLVAHGRNELAEGPRASLWADVVAQLTHPLALLLWLAALLSLLIGTPLLAGAIVAVVALNAVFALWQERQTEEAVSLLRAYLPQSAVALRDGAPTSVPAAELVPGDIILLAEGDQAAIGCCRNREGGGIPLGRLGWGREADQPCQGQNQGGSDDGTKDRGKEGGHGKSRRGGGETATEPLYHGVRGQGWGITRTVAGSPLSCRAPPPAP